MRPLRIAFLSRWYWEENRRWATVEGGPTQQLAEAVAALGHEVIVLSQSPKVDELQRSQIGTLEVWLSPREKRRDFLTAVRDKWAKHTYSNRKVYSDAADLAEFLERRGPFDVLWAHAEEPDGLVAAIALTEGFKLPPLLTQIQALRYRFDNGVPIFNQEPALRLAFRRADRILANSELVAESLAAYAWGTLSAGKLREKVRVVFPNLQREFLEAAEKPCLPPVPGRVLFFGALNEKKGVLIFLEAICRTAGAAEGATFAVAGDFTESNARFQRSWRAALAKAEVSLAPSRIELLGKLSFSEVVRQMQLASVVVFPSLFDEFSRAVMEALALGRPVVTTKGVGMWPLVAEHVCGQVVEPNDAGALAAAIDVLLSPQAHYAANAEHFGRRFMHEVSPEAIALQIGQHLEELAALHKSPVFK